MRTVCVSLPLVLISMCALTSAVLGQANEADAWREDLRVLAEGLPERHLNPFTKISRAQWDSAVASLDARLPRLRPTQFLVELQRLVASIGDAHTTINPRFDPALGMRAYPLDLYLFDDGLFVRRAPPEHASLAGARVLRIGRATTEEAIAAVAPTISHENEWWVKAGAPGRLMMPEMLDGLDLVDDMDRLPFVMEKAGRVDTVVVAPVEARTHHGHEGPAPDPRADWVDMRTSAEPPLWLRNPDRTFWWEYVPESGTLYVGYRAVISPPGGPSNRALWDEVFAFADQNAVQRFVIDIRTNNGGNGFFNRHVIQQILRRPDLNRSDVLYVVIGRVTFSAAQQLANQLEWWTEATFVGEPTGQQPSQYGDHQPLVLPNTGITVNISTRYHQGPNASDRRSFVPPRIYTPLTSADYRDGIDPAMRAILAGETVRPVVALMEEALDAGDVRRAEEELTAARQAEANRFNDYERDVNALGYRLLGAERLEQAIAVFQINTRAYPQSANVYDSLGEALALAGRRDEAIAAYRKALAIDPDYPPSVEGLRRLGARR